MSFGVERHEFNNLIFTIISVQNDLSAVLIIEIKIDKNMLYLYVIFYTSLFEAYLHY